ncbi:hypothetical protein QYF36_026031 [Acer negundo]|nr:hypothetical protein QYF36_026031 [Acer negundo]
MADVKINKITIFHDGDNITSISICFRYDNISRIVCKDPSQDPTTKFRRLQQLFNEVIPKYKFCKNDVMGSNLRVAGESGSNLLMTNFTRECDFTCSICLREFEDSEYIRPHLDAGQLHAFAYASSCDTISNIKFSDDLKLISMECVVQGIIETQHVEALEILLQGLCGVHRERLRVHEICLKNGPNLGNVASEVRLLCDIEQPEPTWTVKHVGGAMRGAGADQISVLVRTMVESKASKNVLRLFYALGYKLDHELLRVGFAFHFQRGAQITVTVSSVNKMLKLHATDEAVPVTPGIQLVEVTAPASSETYSEVAAAVSSFCEYLAPLLHLSKPGVSTGVVPTAAAAAASLMSDGGGTTL